MPPLPDVFSRVQGFLNSSGLPPVFSQLEPRPVHVPGPSSAYANQLAAAVAGSTVKILGQACNYEQEGSGFVAGPGTVVTNAHVVAGESQTQVSVGGRTYPATVVLFDPTFDLAILHTTAVGPAAVASTRAGGPGGQGAVVGYPEDGPLTVDPAAVATTLSTPGTQHLQRGDGDPGGLRDRRRRGARQLGRPAGGTGGQVIGVVFSRSTVYNDVGYALASPDVLARVQAAQDRTKAKSTGTCVEN